MKKTDWATLAGVLYTGLGVIVTFGIWLFPNFTATEKVGYTIVIIICSIISVIAVISKLYGESTENITSNFLFGVFTVCLGAVVIYLAFIEQPLMGFYVFLSGTIASIGTYMLIYAYK